MRQSDSILNAIELKLLSRLVEIDKKKGTYKSSSDGKNHSYLMLRPHLQREIVYTDEQKLRDQINEVRFFFRKRSSIPEDQPSKKIIGMARMLMDKFPDNESIHKVLLRELQIATDHILMFSAHKDARREMIVYSQLSDAFEKTKQENPEAYSYDNAQGTSRPTTQSNRISPLCGDPSCHVPHGAQKPARVAPLPPPPTPKTNQSLSLDFCTFVNPS